MFKILKYRGIKTQKNIFFRIYFSTTLSKRALYGSTCFEVQFEYI